MFVSCRAFRVILSACLVVVFADWASQARAQSDAAASWISAPVVGLVANQDKTEVRAIWGVPGAATLGSPILLPSNVVNVYLAPTQRWAIVKQDPDGLGIMSFSGVESGNVQSIDGALAAPDLISFSPTGRSVSLVSNMGVLQVVTDLDKAPRLAMQSQISDLTAQVVLSTAVSDDGMQAAILTGAGNIFALTDTLPPRLVAHAGLPAGLCFFPNKAAVAIVDGSTGTVTVVENLANLPIVRTTAAGLSLPIGQILAQTSNDGHRLFLSSASGKSAFQIDLYEGRVQMVDLPVPASTLDRLGRGDIFLLSAAPAESAWLLIADNNTLRVVFAPLGSDGSKTSTTRRFQPHPDKAAR